jgi:hypothetical protein
MKLSATKVIYFSSQKRHVDNLIRGLNRISLLVFKMIKERPVDAAFSTKKSK